MGSHHYSGPLVMDDGGDEEGQGMQYFHIEEEFLLEAESSRSSFTLSLYNLQFHKVMGVTAVNMRALRQGPNSFALLD